MSVFSVRHFGVASYFSIHFSLSRVLRSELEFSARWAVLSKCVERDRRHTIDVHSFRNYIV
jgi:hypothetical protein